MHQGIGCAILEKILAEAILKDAARSGFFDLEKEVAGFVAQGYIDNTQRTQEFKEWFKQYVTVDARFVREKNVLFVNVSAAENEPKVSPKAYAISFDEKAPVTAFMDGYSVQENMLKYAARIVAVLRAENRSDLVPEIMQLMTGFSMYMTQNPNKDVNLVYQAFIRACNLITQKNFKMDAYLLILKAYPLVESSMFENSILPINLKWDESAQRVIKTAYQSSSTEGSIFEQEADAFVLKTRNPNESQPFKEKEMQQVVDAVTKKTIPESEVSASVARVVESLLSTDLQRAKNEKLAYFKLKNALQMKVAPKITLSFDTPFKKNTVAKPAYSADADTLKQKIDNYEVSGVNNKNSVEILGESIALLHKGTVAEPVRKARAAFVDFLQHKKDVTKEGLIESEVIGDTGSSLQRLLGKKGVALYEAAIKEERESRAFREACFLKSTRFVPGQTLEKRTVAWIGGPSGVGKSTIVPEVLHTLMVQQSKKELAEGNYWVTVDEGVARATSQMRQLAIQFALSQGYNGISDLEKHTALKVKKTIEQASDLAGLNQVLPRTFTDPQKALQDRNKIKRLSKQGCAQAFVSVTADPTAVKHLGEARAWAKPGAAKPKTFVLNNAPIGCESKAYQGKYFERGVSETKAMQSFFGNRGVVFECHNDLIAIKLTGKNTWKKATAKDKTAQVHVVSQRALEHWQALAEEQKPELMTWLQTPAPSSAAVRPLNAMGTKKVPQGIAVQPPIVSQLQARITFEAMPASSPVSLPIAPTPELTGWERVCEAFTQKEGGQWHWEHQAPQHTLVPPTTSDALPLQLQAAGAVNVHSILPKAPEAAVRQLERLALFTSELVKHDLVKTQGQQAVIDGGRSLEHAFVLYQRFHAAHPSIPVVWGKRYTVEERASLDAKVAALVLPISPKARTGQKK